MGEGTGAGTGAGGTQFLMDGLDPNGAWIDAFDIGGYAADGGYAACVDIVVDAFLDVLLLLLLFLNGILNSCFFGLVCSDVFIRK